MVRFWKVAIVGFALSVASCSQPHSPDADSQVSQGVAKERGEVPEQERYFQAWAANNPEFAADPLRREIMRRAVAKARANVPSYPDEVELFTHAFDEAIYISGWEYRDPVEREKHWNLLLDDFSKTHPAWMKDKNFISLFDRHLDEAMKEQAWTSPDYLFDEVISRVAKDLKIDLNSSRGNKPSRPAVGVGLSTEFDVPMRPDPDAMELECYEAYQAASADPPFGSIATYAQWQKRNQAKLDACLAGSR